MSPFISICIPSYKRTSYLGRLLESIAIQQYKNFEVVISDDTPGEEVKQLCEKFREMLQLKYSHNLQSLGTPENWNQAIRNASGEWIKIMHDDDWFVDGESLFVFADAIIANPTADFFFSAYRNVFEQENNRMEDVHLKPSEERCLESDLLILFRKNYIGNPSCTLFRKNDSLLFDSRFKWVVDFEFYMRYIGKSGKPFAYINKPLVNTSLNSSQVTSSIFRNAAVEIPENHLLLETKGISILKNVLVYDYFWRSYRNLRVTNKEQVQKFGYEKALHPVLESMLNWQRKIPVRLLSIGAFSKPVMYLHYLLHKGQLDN
ncbi:MAG: glycosyltransferase family 2 protein [Chitinophagaceae bacterium]